MQLHKHSNNNSPVHVEAKTKLPGKKIECFYIPGNFLGEEGWGGGWVVLLLEKSIGRLQG